MDKITISFEFEAKTEAERLKMIARILKNLPKGTDNLFIEDFYNYSDEMQRIFFDITSKYNYV